MLIIIAQNLVKMDLKQVVILLMLIVSIQAQSDSCTAPVNTSCGVIDKSDRAYLNGVETRLVVGMKFTCNGTIVGWRVAGTVGRGTQYPKLQVWRLRNASSSSQEYFKPCSDISMEGTVSSPGPVDCDIFEHTLNVVSHVSVQSGDFLGIELPPGNDQAFDILYALDGGPLTYVYRRKLPSPFDLSSTTITPFGSYNVQPLINLIITPESDALNHTTTKSSQDQYAQDVLIGGAVIASVLGVTQILLILAVVLLTVATVNVHKKYKKVITKQPDVQVKTNSAYGVLGTGSQVADDYI